MYVWVLHILSIFSYVSPIRLRIPCIIIHHMPMNTSLGGTSLEYPGLGPFENHKVILTYAAGDREPRVGAPQCSCEDVPYMSKKRTQKYEI